MAIADKSDIFKSSIIIFTFYSMLVLIANVANNWALKVLRVFCAALLTIHVDLPCYI